MPADLDVPRRAPLRVLRSATQTLARRAAGVPAPGSAAGWTSSGSGAWRSGSRDGRIKSPLNVYGGTDESSTWVYACVTLRSQQLAGYQWWLHRPGSQRDPLERTTRQGEVSDLYDLLDEPNDEMSYFDFAEQVQMELDLCGDSFWLLDQQNSLGQPLTLEWLPAQCVKVAVGKDGRRIGYVYQPQNAAIPITYSLREVMHFRNRNPLNRYYGMGVVEAIVRDVEGDLSQRAHVTAFFDQGAHLSGVLTVPETVGEEEFQRMKEQYEREFADSRRAFRVLIAEGADSYTPISQSPAVLGVVDLGRASKDRILSAFGVPEFLLGGTGQGGVYKMEEAQNILHRAMIPVSGRFARRLGMDLAGRYVLDATSRRKQIGFHVDPRQSDTPSAKVERARKLVGTGATIDDMRETAGQERLHWDGISNVPLIPSGLVPVTEEDGFDLRPAGGAQLPPPQSSDHDPTNEPGGDGESNDAPADGDVDEQKSLADLALDSLAPTLPLSQVRALAAPLRDARPQRALATPQSSDAAALRLRVLRDFALAQRERALDHLGQFGATRGGNLRGKPKFRKDQLDPDRVLVVADERADLRQRFEAAGLDDVPLGGWENVDLRTPDDVSTVVREGLRRGYSVSQIATGVPLENYAGILGVFDAITDDIDASLPPTPHP